MPVVPIYLNIDEKTYAGVKGGALELCGMAKNIDSKRIVKHIPAVADVTKADANKAIELIRAYKKETFVVGGVLIIGGTVVGAISYISHRKQNELKKQFGVALQDYLDVAKDGKLTIEELNTLIGAIEEIEKNNPNKSTGLHISASQLSELIRCIFDYTIRLAQASSFNVKSINRPKRFKAETTDDLKYYLSIQREILQQAA